jgi:hypothetical protein
VRMLLLLVIGFIVWKMIRIASSSSRRTKSEEEQEPPFAHIEEAEFEDMSKPPEHPSGPDEVH